MAQTLVTWHPVDGKNRHIMIIEHDDGRVQHYTDGELVLEIVPPDALTINAGLKFIESFGRVLSGAEIEKKYREWLDKEA